MNTRHQPWGRRLTAPVLGVSLAVALGAAALVATAAPAAAAEDCDNGSHRYDCQDPERTGCAADAVNADSTTRTIAGRTVTFELRWSNRCDTNWVRARNWPSGRPQLNFLVADENRDVSAFYGVPAPISAGTHWGNMVYSPAANCARGAVAYDGRLGYDVLLASSTC